MKLTALPADSWAVKCGCNHAMPYREWWEIRQRKDGETITRTIAEADTLKEARAKARISLSRAQTLKG